MQPQQPGSTIGPTPPGQPQAPQSGQQPYPPVYPATPTPMYPAGQPMQPGQNPYDFIINPPASPKKNPLNNMGFGRKLAVILGLFLLVVGILAIISSLASGPRKATTQALANVAVQQQKMLSTIAGVKEERSANNQTKAFAATAQVSLSSSQKQLFTYLAENRMKVNSEFILAQNDAEISEQLTDATASSRYNEVFSELMLEELNKYQEILETSSNQVTGERGTALLQTEYDNANLLKQSLTTR